MDTLLIQIFTPAVSQLHANVGYNISYDISYNVSYNIGYNVSYNVSYNIGYKIFIAAIIAMAGNIWQEYFIFGGNILHLVRIS